MIIFLLILLGLCFGSFVNALVWRLHEQAKSKQKRVRVDLSITKGRSVCPNCKHTLQPLDLVPVVSWVTLRGKCRYCRKPISRQYPAVELISAALFVISFVAWPYELTAWGLAQFIVWLAILVVLLALTVYDVRWMLLPDRLVAIVAALSVVYVLFAMLQAGSISPLAGSLLGVLSLAGLFYVIFQVSDGTWIGGGDVKLGISLGLLAGGLVNGLFVLFLASLMGTLVSLPLLMKGGMRLGRKVPFGPFLIFATFVVVLWGNRIVDWYQNQLLLL